MLGSKTNLLRTYFWPWTFMILLVTITICFLIFKLELRWKTMFSIACINHLPCHSTMTTDFGSISSSVTSSASINICLWLITKHLSLFVVYWEDKSYVAENYHGRVTKIMLINVANRALKLELWYHIMKIKKWI